MAIVLEKLWGDTYKCVSIRSKIWYQYVDGIWTLCDCGNTLRRRLSKNIYDMCKVLQNSAYNNLLSIVEDQDDDDDENEDNESLNSRKFCKKIAKIALKLKQASWKTNIMKEDIFYDKDFINKIDKNVDLLCFTMVSLILIKKYLDQVNLLIMFQNALIFLISSLMKKMKNT